MITVIYAALSIGPYSQGIQTANFIFVADEKGIDPKTGKIVPGASGRKHDRRWRISRQFGQMPGPRSTTLWPRRFS